MRQIGVRTDDWTARRLVKPAVPCVAWLLMLTIVLAGMVTPSPAQNAGPAAGANPGPKLPPGFEAPPPKPEILSIEKRLLPDTADDDFKKIQSKYNLAMRSGSSQERELVADGLKYRILRMANKDQRSELHDRRREVIRDIQQCARLQTNATQAERFRDFVLEQAVSFSEQLLDNNFYVRLNAVILLSELNVDEGDLVRKVPATPFTPAFRPLLAVVADPQQPEAVKIAAVRGISRIARDGELDNASRVEVGKVLTAELKNRDANGWYQTRLAEALGNVDIVRIAVGGISQPLIIQTLVDTVIDQRRHWIVRSEAASSLGRVPLDGQINVDVLSFKIAELGWQMSVAFMRQPREFYWTNCFLKVYLAYKPANSEELQREAGLLTKVEKATFAAHKTAVNSAFDRIRPLAAAMTAQDPSRGPRPLPRDAMQALQKFLAENAPAEMRVDPASPPLANPTAEATGD